MTNPSVPGEGHTKGLAELLAKVQAENDRLKGECGRWIGEFDEKHTLMLRYKADAIEAMALYNQEVKEHAKLEASLLRLSDEDRQLLRMITPSIDQRSREPNDAWNKAAAVLWLLIDTSDPIASSFSRRVTFAAKRLIATIDGLQAITTAERIISGRSDADIRKAGNEAISELRAALADEVRS